MSLLIKGGITKLSELTIDNDKVWLDKGISSIKELALGMVEGDILVHDGTRIIRMPASVAHMVLTSAGILSMPVWAPGGTYLERFFPESAYLSFIAVLDAPDQDWPETPAITKTLDVEGLINPGQFKTLTPPEPTLALAHGLDAPDQFWPEVADLTTQLVTSVA